WCGSCRQSHAGPAPPAGVFYTPVTIVTTCPTPRRRPAMLLENALPAETSAPAAPPLPTLLIVGEPGGLNVAREALIELELGWEVIFAATAAEAHAVPAVRNVDVILVDLGNPYLEGVELVGSLHAKLPHTPIVLMSA